MCSQEDGTFLYKTLLNSGYEIIGLHPVPYRDVSLLEKELSERGFNLYKVNDGKYSELEQLLSISRYDKELENLFIFFSGKGGWYNNSDSLFILPVDERDNQFWLPIDWIFNEIKEYNQNKNPLLKTILVLDAAFKRTDDEVAFRKRIPPNTIIILSGMIGIDHSDELSPFSRAIVNSLNAIDSLDNALFTDLNRILSHELEIILNERSRNRQNRKIIKPGFEDRNVNPPPKIELEKSRAAPIYYANLSNPLELNLPIKVSVPFKSPIITNKIWFWIAFILVIVFLFLFNKRFKSKKHNTISQEAEPRLGSNFVFEIQNLIANDKTDDAISKMRNFKGLKKYKNEILLNSAALKKLESEKLKGIINKDEENLKRQQINNAILEIINTLK